MADDIYTIALRIDPTQANAAVRSVSSGIDSIGKQGSGIKMPFDSLTAGTKNFASGLSGITAALGPIGAALATCGISMKMFLDGAERADALTDMSERLGATVEGLQKMEYALTHMGMSSTQAYKVLEKLNGKFEELKNGEKGVTAAFDRIGISAKDINLQDFEGSLDKVRAAMKAVGIESVDSNKFLKEILGTRDALRAKDFFNGAEAEMRDVTFITKETAYAIKQLKEWWEDLRTSMQNSFLNSVMSALKQFKDSVKEVQSKLDEIALKSAGLQTGDRRLNPEKPSVFDKPNYKADAYVRKDTGQPDPSYNPEPSWNKPMWRTESMIQKGIGQPADNEMRLLSVEEYGKKTEELQVQKAITDAVKATADAQAAADRQRLVAQEQQKWIQKEISEVEAEGADAGATDAERMTNSLGRILKIQREITELQLATTIGREATPEQTINIPELEGIDITTPALPEIKVIDKNAVAFSEALLAIDQKRLALAKELNTFHKAHKAAVSEQETEENKLLSIEEKKQRLIEKQARESAQQIAAEKRADEERNRAMDEYLSMLDKEEGLDEKRLRNKQRINELGQKAGLPKEKTDALIARSDSELQDLTGVPMTQLVKMKLDPKSSDEFKQRVSEVMDKAFEGGKVGAWDSFKVGAAEALGEFSNMSKNMRSIGKQLITGLNEGFTEFFKGIITGTKTGIDAFKNLATNIISQLLAMMTQAMIVKPILEAVMGLAGGGAAGAAGGGGVAGGGGNLAMNVPSGGFSTASIGHTGLVVGGGFMNTYHTGGSPDAIQVLAKRGETIVPQQDQRGNRNSGRGDIKIINVTQNDFAEQCARNPDAILNAVGQRRKQIKSMLSNTSG